MPSRCASASIENSKDIISHLMCLMSSSVTKCRAKDGIISYIISYCLKKTWHDTFSSFGISQHYCCILADCEVARGITACEIVSNTYLLS